MFTPFAPAGAALPSLAPVLSPFSLHWTYTLFGQPASPVALTVDVAFYTMGIQFTSNAGGSLNAIWWFSPPTAADLPSQIALYAVSGRSLVTSQAPSWSGAVASGWVRAPFTTPPALTPGTAYKAAIVHSGTGSFYGNTAHYWDSGAGGSGVTSGGVQAPDNGGADGGQMTFTTPGPQAYPLTSFNASNYWMDVEVGT